MEFINGIQGMKFTPIAGYNQQLKNNAAFDINSDLNFENVLNQKTNEIKGKTPQLKSGVEVNMLFDDFMTQDSSSASSKNTSAASLLKSFGNSIGGGLNSLNQTTQAADRAQEAFAMGEDVSVHDVMISAEKSALSMQLAMQLRNKIMSAYTEINNVRV